MTALALAAPVPALAQGKEDNPKSSFFVINNTAQPLRCAWSPPLTGRRQWSAWFQIPPAANWRIPGGGMILLQCAPPVKRTIYTIAPGARYSLLRAPDGSVDLIKVYSGR